MYLISIYKTVLFGTTKLTNQIEVWKKLSDAKLKAWFNFMSQDKKSKLEMPFL